MEQIKNIEGYNISMQKALDDKLYFLEYLKDIDTFEDFGCADGTILKAVKEHYPEMKLVGVDMNELMLEKCKEKLPDASLIQRLTPQGGNNILLSRALNLSSVLHEVYSYGTAESISAFWKSIMSADYKYIFVRDMIFHNSDYSLVDPIANRAFVKNADQKQIKDFTFVWGPITTKKDMNHFLLKYRYKENWEREVKEQYLWFTPEQLIEMFAGQYECVFLKSYILPFHKYIVKKDMGINLSEDTHIQAVFKKIEKNF